MIEYDKRLISSDALEKLRKTIINNFSENSFNEVGIRDICQQAKVSHKTVYKYFGSKEELMYACIKTDLRAMCERAAMAAERNKGVKAKIQAFADVFFEFYESNPAIARVVYLQIPLINWITDKRFIQFEIHQFFEEVLATAQEQGDICQQVAPEFYVDAIIGILTRVVVKQVADVSRAANWQEAKQNFVTMAHNLLQAK